jgi:hypothetical protein
MSQQDAAKEQVGKLRVAGKRRQLPGVKNDQHANNTDGSGGENGNSMALKNATGNK